MQNVLWERRKIKNDMEIGRTLTLNLNKLIGNGHRQFLLAELNKSNNRLNQKYNNRIYTKAQEEYLLGGEYNEEIEDMARRDSDV